MRHGRNTSDCFWEHAAKLNGNWRNFFPCLIKNGIAATCAMCGPKNVNLYYIGFLTVLDFSAWKDAKGNTWQYGRNLYGAKLGSKDKPGILRKLRRLRERHSGLAGKLFDVYRSGTKVESVGDEFNLVETIEPSKIPEYMAKLGVDIQKRPPVPFKYEDLFKEVSNEVMQQVLGHGGSAAEGGHDEDGDSIPPTNDDDVPF